MGPRRDASPGIAVVALCLVQFVDVMGVTVVVTALPRMLADLGASDSSGVLVATGYAMFFGGLLMLGARLGDRFGHRRTIMVSLAVFAVGAVLAAVATSIVLLTVARCVQGAAAAASVPSALRLLTTLTADGAQRRRAIAGWSAAGAAAGASGFVVGGVVTELTGWRVIFWAYLPLTVVLALAVARSVPSDRSVGTDRSNGSLNVAGSAAFTAAVMAVIVGTTLCAQPGHLLAGAILLVAAVALGAGFVLIDRRAAAPLLPGPVLRLPTLRSGAIGGALNTATTSSAMTLATLYLQDARHRSPLAAATALLPFSLTVIAGSALAAPALRRVDARLVVAAGLAFIAVADGALAIAARSDWLLPVCVGVAGLGIGLSSVAATTLGTDVATTWRSTASGIINTAAQLGTAVGVAVLVLVAAATTGTTGHGTAGPTVAWIVCGAVAAGGAGLFAAQAMRVRRAAAFTGGRSRLAGPARREAFGDKSITT